MVGHWFLVPGIGVRIPVGQHENKALNTPYSVLYFQLFYMMRKAEAVYRLEQATQGAREACRRAGVAST